MITNTRPLLQTFRLWGAYKMKEGRLLNDRHIFSLLMLNKMGWITVVTNSFCMLFLPKSVNLPTMPKSSSITSQLHHCLIPMILSQSHMSTCYAGVTVSEQVVHFQSPHTAETDTVYRHLTVRMTTK